MEKYLIPLTNADLEAWWERVPGARRFLQTMAKEAEHGKAIVADISEDDEESSLKKSNDAIIQSLLNDMKLIII